MSLVSFAFGAFSNYFYLFILLCVCVCGVCLLCRALPRDGNCPLVREPFLFFSIQFYSLLSIAFCFLMSCRTARWRGHWTQDTGHWTLYTREQTRTGIGIRTKLSRVWNSFDCPTVPLKVRHISRQSATVTAVC